MRKALVVAVLLLASAIAYSEGNVSHLKEYEYRADGTPWRCTVYDPGSGKMKGKIFFDSQGILNKVEHYDALGNRTEAAFYDAKRRLKMGPDNWSAMRWYYQDSVMRLQISYDALGKPIERLFYNESGKLMGRLYRDDENVNPYVNAAMYRLLGGNNVGYYDPRDSHNAVSELLSD